MSITEYKVIKSPLDSIASIMATYIADGYQPVGQPVMQFPAEKTVLQVVAMGATTDITDYDIIKAPTDSFAAAMATAIADGFQPFGQPIMLFPDDKTILQAVIKGDASGGGGSVTVVVADISDATDTGKALLLADDEAAARAAIGAGTGNSNLELGSGDTQASAGNHNHEVTADAGSGLAAAANIQELAVALSTRIKVLEDEAP